MGGGAWCAMMAVTPESRGLNSPRSGGSVGKLAVPRLKGFGGCCSLAFQASESNFSPC
ncbi:hypothetical protein K0M31_020301 [Melipona bicolor]|uniref:Uncharacterized protein n=1 Tax=Melipona bicolor TaxID=60889 RepID=A0AA40G160_9HYME|nr:hypothetical protein K0M31_020301 [Melipona bicolor]